MAWGFSGIFLDGHPGGRMAAGTGEPEEVPGRYALAGLVDAHAHPTVAVDAHGPYLGGHEYGAARLTDYAASGVTVIRDAGGRGQVTLGFAGTEVTGRPVVAAAGRFLAPANRYFPRMYSPVAPDELTAAVRAEVAAGATWVKIIGDFPEWGEDSQLPESGLVGTGADSIEHGTALNHAELEALGARGGAWTPTLCAVLNEP